MKRKGHFLNTIAIFLVMTMTLMLFASCSSKGKDGKDGKDGQSAYELACEKGYQGSEEEWLKSLAGENGKDGQNGKGGNGFCGGNAGNGGNGGSSFTNYLRVVFKKENQIGKTGSGGYGNDGGDAYVSLTYFDGRKHYYNIGTVGVAGHGGAQGEQSGASNGKTVTYGTDRTNDYGSNGVVVEPTYTISIIANQTIKLSSTSRAEIVAGGFIGVVDRFSVLNKCASKVNNIKTGNGIIQLYEYNEVISGNFVGRDLGVLEHIVCAYEQDGQLKKYDPYVFLAGRWKNRYS